VVRQRRHQRYLEVRRLRAEEGLNSSGSPAPPCEPGHHGKHLAAELFPERAGALDGGARPRAVPAAPRGALGRGLPGSAAVVAEDPGAGPCQLGAAGSKLSLPRWCGRGRKVDHAALLICSQAWAGVKTPSAEWRRRRL
jgi:hypothetical protein